MTSEEKILAALAGGPKTMQQLYKSVTYCGGEFALEHALHDLVREGKVAVECGVYSAI